MPVCILCTCVHASGNKLRFLLEKGQNGFAHMALCDTFRETYLPLHHIEVQCPENVFVAFAQVLSILLNYLPVAFFDR